MDKDVIYGKDEVTAFVVDLSAAFDSVDHSLLLYHHQHCFEVPGSALNFFARLTNLSPHTQSVYLNYYYSSSAYNWHVVFGVVPCFSFIYYMYHTHKIY